MKAFLIIAILASTVFADAQIFDPQDVHVPLDQAFPIAMAKAKADFSDLDKYLFYSVHPVAPLGDNRGLFWDFIWQEKVFPAYKGLSVRVYMRDGFAKSERFEKGSYQKENPEYLKPSDKPR